MFLSISSFQAHYIYTHTKFFIFLLISEYYHEQQLKFQLSAVHPVIHVPNQLVGAPLGTDVTLECNVEAYPRSINYWMRDTGKFL